MGHIVTVASSKGGVGKSVITTTLSGNLAALGYRVAVIDADPNASYSQWYGLYEGPPIDCSCEVRHEEVVDRAQALTTSHDVVLIDTAGCGNTTAAFAGGTADLVLVPVMPTGRAQWKPCERRGKSGRLVRPSVGRFRSVLCGHDGTIAAWSSGRSERISPTCR